ncbi:hypothetical protein QWY85_20975 [Neolewinella lacunae]|uniref:sulfotransferase-like domain-containing protein n=1 Tax=Neolewinella lacunae TaxID=1517758 RepID=UPI0025B30FBE|nr:hypothetical protein [Neolewinella lacunae]MDN3637158.1 hypothetical protein [Neolewinella lacunae]
MNFLSSPRNISTALMYSFAQHPEVAVVDEPLYAHYLRHQTTVAEHPGREAVLASQENDGEKVVAAMLNDDYGKPCVIFKQMTHHLIALDLAFLDRMQNILLIRDPRAILSSYGKVVSEVSAQDVGIGQQHELYHTLKAAGKLTAVVDSARLLQNPAGVLSRLCAAIGIAYTPAMLQWPAGPRPEDGVWAPYWYANVHASTGFQPYVPKDYPLPPHLEAIAEACQPLYATLLEAAL